MSEATKETVTKREVAARGPKTETLLLVMRPVVAGLTLWQSVILQKVLHNSCTWLAMIRTITRQTESIQLKFLKKCILFYNVRLKCRSVVDSRGSTNVVENSSGQI